MALSTEPLEAGNMSFLVVFTHFFDRFSLDVVAASSRREFDLRTFLKDRDFSTRRDDEEEDDFRAV